MCYINSYISSFAAASCKLQMPPAPILHLHSRCLLSITPRSNQFESQAKFALGRRGKAAAAQSSLRPGFKLKFSLQRSQRAAAKFVIECKSSRAHDCDHHDGKFAATNRNKRHLYLWSLSFGAGAGPSPQLEDKSANKSGQQEWPNSKYWPRNKQRERQVLPRPRRAS